MANGKSGGVGFVGLLTIAFIVLKLVGAISWSWIWVVSPVWIAAGLGILGVILAVIVMIVAGKIR